MKPLVDKNEIWERWLAGEQMKEIAASCGIAAGYVSEVIEDVIKNIEPFDGGDLNDMAGWNARWNAWCRRRAEIKKQLLAQRTFNRRQKRNKGRPK